MDTVKRLCVKKLPPILVIQLKRFDYDFEREQAIKFNDYFEFPRELGEWSNLQLCEKDSWTSTIFCVQVCTGTSPNLESKSIW